MPTLFVIVISILLPDAGESGMIGTGALDQKFSTRQECEDAMASEAAKAMAMLGRQHGRAVLKDTKCVPQDMLLPGADA